MKDFYIKDEKSGEMVRIVLDKNFEIAKEGSLLELIEEDRQWEERNAIKIPQNVKKPTKVDLLDYRLKFNARTTWGFYDWMNLGEDHKEYAIFPG